MSEAVRYDYGTSLCSVQESSKLIVEECDPTTIKDELRAANFIRKGSKFVKKRPRLRSRPNGSNSDPTGLQVLTVRVVDDKLHVEPSDVVGIVRLVPGMSVQVEPKIDWNHVIEMLLTVYDIERTQSYYGVPLDELVSSGVESTRIIAILAINYVHGLRTVRRNGFIRDLNIRRRNGFQGIGSVDVEQTLMNHATGNPAPSWVETEVEYSNPVNSAIHMAGKLLLRLLQQDREGRRHPRQDVLLSMVHQEVERMEELEIQSSQKHIGTYRRLSLHDLPRQRHYYRRAFHTAQSLLSSTLLGQAGGGPQELLVDYALSMNTLFQDYSHRLLNKEIESVRKIDYLDQLSGVNCKPEYPIYPFEGNSDARHEPDHLLTNSGDTLAVLDSKYYQEGKNPANDSDSRSRMFAYAYLTDCDRMAFLCPQYRHVRLPVQDTDAEIEVISPEDEFTCEEYRDLIREYILSTLAGSYPELLAFDAATTGHLCLSGTSESDLSQVYDTGGPFSISNAATFADRVISAIVFSSYGPNKPELDDQGRWTKSRIKDACQKSDEEGHPRYPQHETTCVPVYSPDGDAEHGTVTLYFIRSTEDGDIVRTEGPWALM
ncbi:hypothetical protein [Halobellus sp. H-GB7]|uniref:hypothetical protein n=1 Tax=Halobellus sp. H-GB7 TaxID=3069756 RepID=UPI0027B77C76|nr:hypothetical protein [Halobellus sp. H-GB7]MDQ2055874.1 hypothetical protein [Halobellus sp. H-GB7]